MESNVQFHTKVVEDLKVVKFICNEILTSGSSRTFNNIEEARESSLIQKFFHYPFVKRVLVVANMIVVERYNITLWEREYTKLFEDLELHFVEQKKELWDDVPKPPKDHSGKVSTEVYVEQTPNPQVMKFVCNRLLFEGLLEYTSLETAQGSPLAQKIFEHPSVLRLFISENYISIAKKRDFEWQEIQGELRDFIADTLKGGVKVLDTPIMGVRDDSLPVSIKSSMGRVFEGVEKEIAEIIDQEVSPAVAMDGGHISLQGYDAKKKLVTVKLHGACSGCPSSQGTLKGGVETILKSVMPHKVEAVEAVV